jgi:hypothetical protein
MEKLPVVFPLFAEGLSMSKKSTDKRYGEDQINYWVEHLCGGADTVYRVAFALTLSKDGARQCLVQTYKELAEELGDTRAENQATKRLLGKCWKVAQKMGGQSFKPDDSPIEARAALAAVDVVGLAAAEAGEVFGWDEKDMRRHLAVGRQALLGANL